MRVLRVLPVAVRMIAIAIAGIAATAVATWLLSRWLQPWAAALISAAVIGSIVATVIWRALVPMRALFRALAGTVASYRDGDFSFGITWDKASDLIELVDEHNALGNALREVRRQGIRDGLAQYAHDRAVAGRLRTVAARRQARA